MFAAIATVALGCTSPTLPLPPPAAPSESLGTDANTIVLTGPVGGAIPGALIVVQNDNPQFTGAPVLEATLVANDGSWTDAILAVKNDHLHITEYVGNDNVSIDFTVLIN